MDCEIRNMIEKDCTSVVLHIVLG